MSENTEKHILKKINESKNYKKFVINVHSDNIEFVENLSDKEKNEIVNQLLADYRVKKRENDKYEAIKTGIKRGIIVFLLIIAGIPFALHLISVSLDMTKSSYTDMQKNFEKLF